MDIISFNEASTANERIERFNANPDSDSGVLTQPKVIEAGETVTVKSGRQAILADTVVDGDLVIEAGGDVFIPAGAGFSVIDQRIDALDNETVKLTGDQTIEDVKEFTSDIIGNITGNSTTATKLETARTIGGVSFDGTADISLPGVNTTGDQDTTGNAASATKWTTARTITMGGDLTGSVPIDGSTDVTLSAQVADDSHNHTGLSGTVRFSNSGGNAYNNSNIEVMGNGVANTIKPSIGFHQPALYAGTLSMEDRNTFQFKDQNGNPAILDNSITGLGTAATRDVGTGTGNVMEVGAFGISTKSPGVYSMPAKTQLEGNHFVSIFNTTPDSSMFNGNTFLGVNISSLGTGTKRFLGVENNVLTYLIYNSNSESIIAKYKSYHSGNTTVDPNGFIKSASPIIDLYTDKIEIHNESEVGATPIMERIEKGVYEIRNTLGLRLNDGWYIDTPSDRNGNKYFNIEWTQNITPDTVDGVVDEYRDDIVVTIETFERVWNKDTGLFENGNPIDINDLQNRFVQLRFNEIKVEQEIING